MAHIYFQQINPESNGIHSLHAQTDASLFVYFQYLDLDDVAFREFVADFLDAFFGNLRDMHQTVTPRQYGDEGTKIHEFRNLALINTPDFHISGDVDKCAFLQ